MESFRPRLLTWMRWLAFAAYAKLVSHLFNGWISLLFPFGRDSRQYSSVTDRLPDSG